MKAIDFGKPVALALLSAAAFGSSVTLAQVPEQQDAQPPAETRGDVPLPPEQSATSATPDTTAPPKAAQTVAVDEQKIEQFADAYVAVQTIQSKAAAELEKSAADPAKQQQTQAAAENEMIAAVERTGLKLEEFNGIVQSMTADADLRARVVAEIRERSGG